MEADDCRDEILRLAFTEGNRTFAAQTDALNQARTRAGILLSAGAVAASFLGKSAMESFDASKRPALYWVCWALFLALGVTCAFILAPIWRWTTSTSPRVLAEHYANESGASFDRRMTDLVAHQSARVDENEDTLVRVHWLLTGAVTLLFFGTALWVWLAIVEAPG